MAQFRPAGLSDEDSESDDYGYNMKPARPLPYQQHNVRKKIEIELQDAIINGDISAVEKIVQCDLHNVVNMKLDSGWTPLIHACFHAQDKIVKFLLDLGADPNLHADSVTPIMAACSNSSANNDTIYSIILNLIEKGSILNIGDKYGQTPLMRAISNGRVAVVRKLLDSNANMEMRDQQGWTAVFWAVHHKQPEILEMLIERDARLSEVDKSGRTPLDIASSHDYENIIEILNKNSKTEPETEDSEKTTYSAKKESSSWLDLYPGLYEGKTVDYTAEISRLLYGMNCERLWPLIAESGIDLKTFLLLDEESMIDLGIEMPFERQRLLLGLRKFHLRGWRLDSVAGLYACKSENYSVLDCLTSLGAHLQQVYILDATLEYTLRGFAKIQDEIEYETPDPELVMKLKTASRRMRTNINNIRRESQALKHILVKISDENPEPCDLVREDSNPKIVLSYLSEAILICSLSLFVYHAKNLITYIATGK
ncbi:ankyrin repeat, SAM and basic leucine zipper domain-containing protein 1 isoform X2 [Hyposmocoma kahamanoa]|uniref:ankyrin repeat, SAM and basic leucine zipper domain-containing protein 1 isoform X2 n=1 Tax=Hyposmocoma kahamanoa TaxID=1477025 RepID=UPI000E6D977D|nr:ankyrin repeat, SAM and basic leucine zipper domain-containing protein 1 isoform X2 [Hyposmocoma kahamanoa]